MSTQAYKDWVTAGRPFHLAQPIADYRGALHAAGWPLALLGTIGNEEHLQAETPQDHCPFSMTGWPEPNEYPYVHALDVMHHPDQGLDVAPLAEYWLAEARAGRTPWVKYLNWAGHQYDVRHDWEPRSISGHFDHAHLSVRTDWTHQSIGTWPVVKKGNTMTTSEVGKDVWAETIDSPDLEYAQPASEWLKWTLATYRAVVDLQASVKALSDALQPRSGQGGSPVDPHAATATLVDPEAFADRLAAALKAGLNTVTFTLTAPITEAASGPARPVV